MKVLIVGGPRDGKTFVVQPDHHEMRSAVLAPKFLLLRTSHALDTKSSFETVENHFFRYVVSLPNGKDCTLVLAITEEAMENMSVPEWLDLLAEACDKGCIL